MATPNAAQQQFARAQAQFAQALASRNPLAITKASQALARATRTYRAQQKPPSSKPSSVVPRVTRGKMVDQPAPPRQQAFPSQSSLDYYTQNGQVNLIEVAQVKDTRALSEARQLWGDKEVDRAIHLAKTPVTREVFERKEFQQQLTPSTRKNIRIIEPVPAKEYYRMTPDMKADHYPEGIKAEIYAELGPGAQKHVYPELTLWKQLTPWEEEKGEVATTKNVLAWEAELLVPGVYTAKHWKKLSGLEKGAGIALDLASIIPGATLASAARRAGASIPQTLAKVAVVEAKAPIDTILHPRQAVKPWAHTAEVALHPRGVPMAGTEVRSMTVQVPVKEMGAAKDAMAARDILMDKSVQGIGPTAVVGNKQITLTTTSLQNVVKGVAVHSTPDIRPFMKGAVIKEGREGGLFVAPNIHSRFTRASAFGDIPKGGIPGALIITDKKILAKLSPTGKIFDASVEMEKLLKAGEVLPSPSQFLFTRDVLGNRLTLAVIGEPLSKRQIAALKFMGPKDVVKGIFKAPYKIKGNQPIDKLVDLAQEEKRLKRQLKAVKSSGNKKEIHRLESEISDINTRARNIAAEIDRAGRAARPNALRPVAVSFDDFTLDQVYREYARRDPEAFARWVNGHPKDTRQEILSALPPRTRKTIERKLGSRVAGPKRYSGSSEYRERVLQEHYPGEQRVEDFPSQHETKPGRVAIPDGDTVVGKVTVPKTSRKDTDETVKTRQYRSSDIVIKEVKGKPPKGERGSVSWNQGVVRITITPPYREGSQDVHYERRDPPAKGKGSPQGSIKVTRGKAPEVIELGMGATGVIIKNGKTMLYGSQKQQRGPGLLLPSGKLVKQKRGSVLK